MRYTVVIILAIVTTLTGCVATWNDGPIPFSQSGDPPVFQELATGGE